jgi:hypothetical protein
MKRRCEEQIHLLMLTSFIGFAAMPHSDDAQTAVYIFDLIDYPVITNTHAPAVLCPDEFATA